ncbi:hypothetical protein CDAR_16101 [Caerostris darwini]|uniref:Uncharacterized protein n=1 Tax=Caerostris darwini TaxID=1538125 RepID=A0AAV4QRQ2_9ARAC|nr:hypothetical protein CDAR_16101 [Caerostris darwini]
MLLEAMGKEDGKQVDVEMGEVRQEEPGERCDELVEEVSMETAWVMRSTEEGKETLTTIVYRNHINLEKSGFFQTAEMHFSVCRIGDLLGIKL